MIHITNRNLCGLIRAKYINYVLLISTARRPYSGLIRSESIKNLLKWRIKIYVVQI